MKNFVSYANATALMTAIGEKLELLKGAYVIKGNIAFENLPGAASMTPAMNGWVYNITNDFTTDARFVEGAGKAYAAGTNIVTVDLSTYDIVIPEGNENPSTEGWYELISEKYVLSEDETVDPLKTYYEYNIVIKYDSMGMFVDVAGIVQKITDTQDMLALTFDDTENYHVDDVVIYEDKIYKFIADHDAGAWDSEDVELTTIKALIDDAEPEELTSAQVNNLIDLLS